MADSRPIQQAPSENPVYQPSGVLLRLRGPWRAPRPCQLFAVRNNKRRGAWAPGVSPQKRQRRRLGVLGISSRDRTTPCGCILLTVRARTSALSSVDAARVGRPRPRSAQGVGGLAQASGAAPPIPSLSQNGYGKITFRKVRSPAGRNVWV